MLHVDGLVLLAGTWRRAALEVDKAAKKGTLPASLQQLVPIANARAGKDGARTLSLRSLYRWHAEREAGGVNALAPKERAEASTPAWAPYFLKLYRIPSKPSIAESMERLAEQLPPYIAMPSYDQVKRFLTRMDVVERNRGRMGPHELKAIRPYVMRDTSTLWPLDVVSADGHTLDAEVQHPKHGRPFRPEITSVIDYATHACVGWSVSLKENAFGVMEAILYMVKPGPGCAHPMPRRRGSEGMESTAPSFPPPSTMRPGSFPKSRWFPTQRNGTCINGPNAILSRCSPSPTRSRGRRNRSIS